MILSTLQIIFWFRPLVWLARGRLIQAMEEACDQTVLNLRQDINNQFYALTLLKVLTQKSVGLRFTPAMASPKALVIR